MVERLGIGVAVPRELPLTTFQVVALSVDRAGMDAVKKFYSAAGIKNLAAFNDPSAKATAALGAVGLPTTLLLDRDGHELGRFIGPAEWDQEEMVAFVKSWIK